MGLCSNYDWYGEDFCNEIDVDEKGRDEGEHELRSQQLNPFTGNKSTGMYIVHEIISFTRFT